MVERYTDYEIYSFLVSCDSSHCVSGLLQCIYLFYFIGEIEELFTKALANKLSDDDQILLQEVIDIVHRPEHISASSLEYSSETRTVIIEPSCRMTLLIFGPNILYYTFIFIFIIIVIHFFLSCRCLFYFKIIYTLNNNII